MRRMFVGILLGSIIGVILGVTILSPKLKTHAASKAVLSERDLEREPTDIAVTLPSLYAGDVLTWRSAPPYPSDRPNVAELAEGFAQQLAVLSGDQIILPVQTARETIARDRLFGAIASGRIDALFATAAIGIDKEPALALFGAIPFGPKSEDVLAWIQGGSGGEKLESLFANHNIQALVCGYMAPESAGWFVNEVASLGELENLRIQIKGLGAKVWTKAGAQVQELAAEDIASAFEAQELDAAVYASPKTDVKTNFARFAKTYYYPGWQNQGQPLLLLINSKSWNALNQERKALVRTACRSHTSMSLAREAQEQFAALSEITQQGVTLHRLPTFLTLHLREAWQDVLAEEARRNQDFRETWEDLKAFVALRESWADVGYLPSSNYDF